MEWLSPAINMENVKTIVYHMPDGQPLALPVQGYEDLIEFGPGDICDTSEVNGILHFFPKGNC